MHFSGGLYYADWFMQIGRDKKTGAKRPLSNITFKLKIKQEITSFVICYDF
jgi:hypothetical protein